MDFNLEEEEEEEEEEEGEEEEIIMYVTLSHYVYFMAVIYVST